MGKMKEEFMKDMEKMLSTKPWIDLLDMVSNEMRECKKKESPGKEENPAVSILEDIQKIIQDKIDRLKKDGT